MSEQRLLEERINITAKGIALFLLIALPGPLLFLFFLNVVFRGLGEADAMDCAQIARHIYRGDGFVTSYIRPLSLAVHPSLNPHHPDLLRAPLHPFITALFFGLMGPSDKAAAVCSGIFYLLTIPLIYFLAKKMFDKRVALVSLIFYVISLPMLSQSISGLALSLAVFLFTLLIFFLYKGENSLKNTTICGLLYGLLYLTGYSFLVFLLPILIYLFFANSERRAHHIILFLASFLVVISPWLYRNYAVTGDPFFTLRRYEVMLGTTSYPAYSLYRTFNPDLISPVKFVFTHFREVIVKFVNGLSTLYNGLPALASLYLMPFFILSLFFKFGSRKLEILRICFYLMILMLILAKAFGMTAVELFVQFVPLVIILSVAALFRLLDSQVRFPALRYFVIVILGLVILYPTLVTSVLAVTRGRIEYPSIPNLEYLQKTVSKKDLVASDVPWAVAWYSDRNCLWLPRNAEEFRKIDKTVNPINFVYLSYMLPSYRAEEGVDGWKQIYYLRVPFEDYVPVKGLRGPELLYVKKSMAREEKR